MPAPFGWVTEDNDQAAAQGAAEAAAATMRRQVPAQRIFGSLAPSPLEKTATALGEMPGNVLNGVRRFTEGAMNMPLGASIADYPGVADGAAETALALTMIPGGRGGLGSGARIASPAVRMADKTYTGLNHAQAVENAAQALRTTPEALLSGRGGVHPSKMHLEGYVDDAGNYLDRKQAARIADRAEQTPYEPTPGRELLAEDLSPEVENVAPKTREAMRKAAEGKK